MIVQKGIPKQRIDTGRIEAKSFLARKKIIEIYVESQEDVTFWRKIFVFFWSTQAKKYSVGIRAIRIGDPRDSGHATR